MERQGAQGTEHRAQSRPRLHCTLLVAGLTKGARCGSGGAAYLLPGGAK